MTPLISEIPTGTHEKSRMKVAPPHVQLSHSDNLIQPTFSLPDGVDRRDEFLWANLLVIADFEARASADGRDVVNTENGLCLERAAPTIRP